MAFCLIILIQLITIARCDVMSCLRTWYRDTFLDVSQPTGISATAPRFTHAQILSSLPACIATISSTTDACMNNGVDFRPISKIFTCINAEVAGEQIQKPDATALFWSGTTGENKAISEAQDHVDAVHGWNPKKWKKHVKGKYNDRSIEPLQNYYNYLGGIHDIALQHQFIDFGCMWLAFNSKPKSHNNGMDAYSSLKGYELDDSGTANRGKDALLGAAITKALVINNFFWRTELVAIARLFESLTYAATSTKSRSGAKMRLHMKTYTVTATAATEDTWDTKNIFGALDTLTRIPVVFEGNPPNEQHVQWPIFKGTHAAPVSCNLKDLIDVYNSQFNHAHRISRITGKLHMEIPKLILFISWTIRIPFHIFNEATHQMGGWADLDAITHEFHSAGDIPGGAFAHSAPYNNFVSFKAGGKSDKKASRVARKEYGNEYDQFDNGNTAHEEYQQLLADFYYDEQVEDAREERAVRLLKIEKQKLKRFAQKLSNK